MSCCFREKRHPSLQKKNASSKDKPKWQHKDVNSDSLFNKWDFAPPTFDDNLLSHQLFERFITNKELERICDKSTRYVRQKGNHNFIMTKRKLKSFLAIIIVSGYASLPWQDMYWQMRDDM